MIALSLCLAPAARTSAAPNVYVNVDPELAVVTLGDSVTLTATLRDGSGSPPNGTRQVRWYFSDASANSPASPGGNPDLTCATDAGGACSVSYVALVAGIDEICAMVAGNAGAQCTEPQDAPEWDDAADVVLRTIVDPSATLSPSPSASESPTSSPLPTDSPTPAPSDSPGASPSDAPSPTPSDAPSGTATPDPTGAPSDSATPTPSPAASPSDSPAPAGSPTESATPSVLPVPSATPPEPTPQPAGSDIPTPGPSQDVVTPPSATPTTDPVVDPTPPAPPAPSDPPADPAPAPTTASTTAPVDAASDASPAPSQQPDLLNPVDRSPEPVAYGTWPQGSAPPAPRIEPALVAPPATQPAPNLVGAVLGLVGGQAERVVKPQAAAAVAATFGFPLVLMLAVLFYLLAQGWIDRRDPKLRAAPRTAAETVAAFREEHEL